MGRYFEFNLAYHDVFITTRWFGNLVFLEDPQKILKETSLLGLSSKKFTKTVFWLFCNFEQNSSIMMFRISATLPKRNFDKKVLQNLILTPLWFDLEKNCLMKMNTCLCQVLQIKKLKIRALMQSLSVFPEISFPSN